ncbi:MAG TPA: glycosyltransferase family 1 protein [Chitinophagaceae bacterium]|nr:glycosyltransferase family 1 protein [Chitinophagaceae bacterium]
MNIAFDAKRAFTNGTGLGHYSRTLITSLAEYFPAHEYFLCTPKLTSRYNTAALHNVHTVTPHRFPSTLLTAAWRSKWVVRDLRRLDIDLYHGLSHEIPVGIQHTAVKSVVTIHDLIFERYPQQYNAIDVKIYRSKFRYACANANRIIAISKQTRDDIVQFYNVPPKKIDVCYQSCNPAFGVRVPAGEIQRIKQQYKLPQKFFLYVGSVIERKNLLTICKALALLKGKVNTPLVVIGDGGAYLQQVKDFIAANNLQAMVRLLSGEEDIKGIAGYTSAADFPAIYQQALCMIYPSTFEGFGIPVLEALYSRLPVITSNVSCLPEAGGPGALYINPPDAAQLADAMERVNTDEALRADMIEKGWQHAQSFSPYNCARAVMDVYEKTI